MAGAIAIAIAACNALTGASDLAIDDPTHDADRDAAPSDGNAGAADRAPPDDVTVPPLPDASGDGGCTGAAPTSFLGSTKLLAPGTFELTPATSGLAGAVVAPAMIALDAYDVTFDFSLTYAATTPAAGVAFFAIAAPQATLGCNVGPRLCTLGGSAPGFAVILRTSKVGNNDPAVPYLAVVDAQSYPATVPTNPPLVDPTLVATELGSIEPGVPAASTFRQMAITVRSDKVTVTIDGKNLIKDGAIPGYVPGRLVTWGVGGATGQGISFAHRTVVRNVVLTCR